MGYVTDFAYFGEGVGAHICRRWHQDLAADIDLDRESFGLNYPRTCSGTPHIFFFLKARRAVMGPAQRGPIWAG